MPYARKIVLHSVSGVKPELEMLIDEFIRDGVNYVGVVGIDCALIEDIIDEICVGDATASYFMLTASHPDENVEEALQFARSFTGEYQGEVQVIEL